MRWLRSHPRSAVMIGAALTGGVAWLVFGFFGFHLLFVDDEVDEALPVFTSTELRADSVATTLAPPPTPPPETTVAATVPAAVDVAPTTTVAATPPHPQIVVSHRGDFVSREHPATGEATVLGDGSGVRFLRFEQFETDNGPDVNVYLVNSSAGGVADFVDLGDLKGNIGDQNYEIPTDVDLGVHDTVVLWCVRFSSPFGEASLAVS